MNTDPFNSSLATTPPRWRGIDVTLLSLLMLVTAIVLAKDITVSGFRHGDASAHAMDGVLIHDWIAAGPRAWFSPMEFATQQYAHYPTLGIGSHYPPGYALVEAVFFALFGVSPFSARFCVVCFGLLAAVGTYTFMRSWTDRLTGVLAAVILVTIPETTTWGRQNMLEVPTLAVMVWTAVALTWYFRRPTGKRLAGVTAFAILAILFKQPAVFLIGVVAVTVVFVAWRGGCRRSHAIVVLLIAVVVMLATVLSLGSAGRQVLGGDFAGVGDRFGLASLTWYAKLFPVAVPIPYLLVAVVGLVVSCRKLGPTGVFLVVWLCASYAMISLVNCKNPRFLYLVLFPPAMWAAVGLGTLLSRIRVEPLRVALAGVTAAAGGAVALAAPIEHRPNYGVIVQAHRHLIEGHVVLFSGLRDGDFVFAVRQYLPWRRSIIIRGSKLLYTCSVVPELDFESRVSTRREVSELLDKFAFQNIFVERENKLKLTEDAILRDCLSASEAYRLIAVHPLHAEPVPTYRDVTIDVYQATNPKVRTAEHFDIHLPNAARTIRVDLDSL